MSVPIVRVEPSIGALRELNRESPAGTTKSLRDVVRLAVREPSRARTDALARFKAVADAEGHSAVVEPVAAFFGAPLPRTGSGRALLAGLHYALEDDARLSPNDVEGLVPLAKCAGAAGLAGALQCLESTYVPPPRRKTRSDSGFAKTLLHMDAPANAFNADKPWLVLGRPEGAGDTQGSLHVLEARELVVELGREARKELVVFSNPFLTDDAVVEPKPVRVWGSADGRTWRDFGEVACAEPVHTSSASRIDPRSARAGGDRISIPDGEPVRFVKLVASKSSMVVDSVYGH